MSLFPAYFGARKRAPEDSAPPEEPENESRADVFNLIPPRADEKYERPKTEQAEPAAAESAASHPVTAMDLTRLSIDNDGRLFWDGKPVKVQRQLMLSRNQAIGACVVAAFIVLGSIGSVLQATATINEWTCRIGMASCAAPAAPARPLARPDIPA